MKKVLSIITGIIFIACGIGMIIYGGHLVLRGYWIGLPCAIGGGSLAATGIVIIEKGDVWEAFRLLFLVLMRIP